jgi:hypothetical protein
MSFADACQVTSILDYVMLQHVALIALDRADTSRSRSVSPDRHLRVLCAILHPVEGVIAVCQQASWHDSL